jgi:hypothetical protein
MIHKPILIKLIGYVWMLNFFSLSFIKHSKPKASGTDEHSPDAGLRFFENGTLGKSALCKPNTVWVEWGFVNTAARCFFEYLDTHIFKFQYIDIFCLRQIVIVRICALPTFSIVLRYWEAFQTNL